jgi:hypothetical protein
MQELRHVLWIGGGSGAGKTTIATRLARRYGLRWYSADAQTWRHRDRAVAAGHPAALRFESLSFAERERCTPAELLELGLHEERGPMIVDDLRELPAAPLVVAEGSTLPPFVVSAGIAAPGRGVWLLPTAEFAEARLYPHAPLHARPLLVETWHLGVERTAREVAEHRAPSLVVDGSRDLDEMTALVEERFGDALAEGPRAETAAERRALLREGNEQILAQCLGFLSRPWAGADEATYTRAFHCECDDPGCDAVLELTVAEAARRLENSGRLLAHAAGSVSVR